MTEPMISLGMVISVVREATSPALAEVECPKEAAELASEAKVAAARWTRQSS